MIISSARIIDASILIISYREGREYYTNIHDGAEGKKMLLRFGLEKTACISNKGKAHSKNQNAEYASTNLCIPETDTTHNNQP